MLNATTKLEQDNWSAVSQCYGKKSRAVKIKTALRGEKAVKHNVINGLPLDPDLIKLTFLNSWGI